MKYIVSVFIAGLLLSACNNNNPKTTENKTDTAKVANADSAAAAQDFFPVADYIGGQVKIIDSLQLPISKTVTINGQSKLSAATDKDLRILAMHFRQPDINDPALKKFYSQTSIADQSVPSVTLMFTTTNTTLEIQKVNVYIKPDPIQNDKVTSIYMEKSFKHIDTSFNQKLFWKTDKDMQVITEKTVSGKTLPVEQVKISWNYSN